MHLVNLLAAALLAQPSAPNLDFRQGGLEGWEGSGFHFAPAENGRPAGAWSKDRGPTRKGTLRYVFTVPSDAKLLKFQAYAEVLGDAMPDARLTVVLAGADGRPVPMQYLNSSSRWEPAGALQLPWRNMPRTYAWDVTSLRGKRMQVVLLDQDERTGHYVYAGDFRFVNDPTAAAALDPDFAPFMLNLQNKHQLTAMARFDSKRFTAIGNADERFITERLQNCETFFDLFLGHFRAKGFTVTPPSERLMVAVFDNHAGFDAYFGRTMNNGIAGIYHTPTNRLVLYDFAENRGMIANKEAARRYSQGIFDRVQQAKARDTIDRQIDDYARDANLSVTMHECAHLISFNCGLLNRHGDPPAWLVEGMATYCEATDHGDWTVLGAVNPMRLSHLVQGRNNQLSLTELVRSDDWLRSPRVLLGYAQGWLLFHLLLTEKPREMRRYLDIVRERKTPESRLADFQEAFGSLTALAARYQAYQGEMLARRPTTAAR